MVAFLTPWPAARGDEPPVAFSDRERRLILKHSPLPPPPPDPTNAVAQRPEAVALGQFLFFDVKLSSNGKVACATCHDPQKAFADGKPLAEAIGQATRHTPALWNVAYNRWLFWDGRADSLWAQALQPLENPVEHASDRRAVLRRIRDDPPLRRAYESLFAPLPDSADALDRHFANVGKAIAAYVSQIISRHAPFDTFAEGLRRGDPARLRAISPAAQRGLKLFVGRGNCRICHAGPTFTDGQFHDIRVPPRHGGAPTDPGRFDGVQQVLNSPFNAAGPYSDDRSARAREHLEFLNNPAENWGRFKSPTLRNVALTAPYMHQGQFATLADVLHYYSTFEGAVPVHHQVETILAPLRLTADETADLLAFLESLTDTRIDERLLRPPAGPLPVATATRTSN